jgi:hypothetical protein
VLNWITRYAPVAALVLGVDGRLGESLLDVGSGSVGFASVGGSEPFVGIDIDFWGPPAPSMTAVRALPGRLPFADGSFDTVISLDALEHVPPADRDGFVTEIARVAARRAIIACPCDEATAVDDLLRRMYLRRGEAEPDWLSEHAEHGLPTRLAVAQACAAPSGFSARALPMPNGLLSLLAVVADTDPELAVLARAEVGQRAGLWTGLFASSADLSSFRVGWVLERRTPLPPIARRESLAETMIEALLCPRCGDCVPALRRDAAGVLDLTGAWSCG